MFPTRPRLFNHTMVVLPPKITMNMVLCSQRLTKTCAYNSFVFLRTVMRVVRADEPALEQPARLQTAFVTEHVVASVRAFQYPVRGDSGNQRRGILTREGHYDQRGAIPETHCGGYG